MVIWLHCPNLPLRLPFPIKSHWLYSCVFPKVFQGWGDGAIFLHYLGLDFVISISSLLLCPTVTSDIQALIPYNCFCSNSREAHENDFPGIIFYQTSLQTGQQCWQQAAIICIHFLVPSGHRLGPASPSMPAQVGPEAHRGGLLLHLLAWQQLRSAAFEFLTRQALALNQETNMLFIMIE